MDYERQNQPLTQSQLKLKTGRPRGRPKGSYKKKRKGPTIPDLLRMKPQIDQDFIKAQRELEKSLQTSDLASPQKVEEFLQEISRESPIMGQRAQETSETTSQPLNQNLKTRTLEELYGQSPAEKPEDIRLRRFKEYIETEWGPAAVTMQLRALFGNGYPPIPPPQRWTLGPYYTNLEQLIWEQVQTESFIEEIWPSVQMLLGDDVCNSMWAAQVATTLALFNLIRILPLMLTKET